MQASAGRKRLLSGIEEIERRVQQRGLSREVLNSLKANSISTQCLLGSLAADIAEECELPLHDVEMLQWDESTWNASLEAIWQRMKKSDLTEDIVRRTKIAVEAAGLTAEGLRAASKQRLKEIGVPVAARFFFEQADWCASDQHEPRAPNRSLDVGPSSESDLAEAQANAAGAHEDEVANSLVLSFENNCSCRESSDGDEDQVVSGMGIKGDAVPAHFSTNEERGGVVVGGRFDVYFDDKEWYPATVMYVSGGDGILVYDDDQSVGFLSESLLETDQEIRRSSVPAPEHGRGLLLSALQCQDDDWHWLIGKYLRNRGKPCIKDTGTPVKWTLQILAQLSYRMFIEGKRSKSALQFTGKVLGRGGFGIVVETTAGAMKMEIIQGSPSFTVQPLWRDYQFFTLAAQAGPDSTHQSDAYTKNRRALKKHVPREMILFKNMAFAQIYEDQGNYTISLLGMEKLGSGPEEILQRASKIFQDERRVDDSARLLAMDVFSVLHRLKAAGVAHCDLKPEHLKHRQDQNGPVLVVIDGSLCRHKHIGYRTGKSNSEIAPAHRSAGKFVTASASIPRNTSTLSIMGDPKRQGTVGYRAPSREGEKTFVELLANDVFSVGVSLLQVVGLVPGRTKRDAEKFEENLYRVLEKRNFNRFLELCPGYRAGEKDGGLDSSTIRWFKLCFEMLNLDFATRITPEKALSSSMLLHPNYEQKLFEQMCGEGVVVFDQNGLQPVMKPLCLLYSPNHGIIVYRLLNYTDREPVGRYGGELLAGDFGLAAYSLHNLSCSGDHILFGAVSIFHSLESFIQTCCIGSFFESSRDDPDILQPGNCHGPDRLGPRYQLKAQSDKGTSSVMTYIPMLSKRAQHSTRASWCYPWTAGYGEQHMAQEEIQEKKNRFALPVPPHFQEVLKSQRQKVLQMGFVDSWQDQVELDQGTAASAAIAACTQPSQLPPSPAPPSLAADVPGENPVYSPLPDNLVKCLEAADTMQYQRFDWSKVMEGAPVITRAEQIAAGIPVLPDIPMTRSAFAQAVKGQRAVMMDGTNIAIEAAETIKIRDGYDLYSRLCDQTPAKEKAQAEGGKEEHKGKRRQRKAGSGGGGSKRENKSPHVPSILRVIYAYCMGCLTSFANIFQTFTAGGATGDNRRRECKGDKWPRPRPRQGESNESFLDRLAGYKFLLAFYDIVFYRTANVLPSKADIRPSLDRAKTSLLLSDASKGDVKLQDWHLDTEPMHSELNFSVLMNLSSLISYIGLVINSGPNIDHALEFEANEFGGKESFNETAHLDGQFRNRYLITRSTTNPEKLLSEVMSEKGFKEADVLRYAWSRYLQAHAELHPDKFKKMWGAWAEMQPLMLVAFDNRVLHRGPPFPMPPQSRNDLEILQHFR